MNRPESYHHVETESFSEKQDTQKFWLAFIRDKFGIIQPEDYLDFEKKVEIDTAHYIDVFVPSTGIIIEQKSPGKSLEAAFVQAREYYNWLPFSQKGRYILTCDFHDIHIHDMDEPTKAPEIIPVSQATKDNLSFLVVPGKTLPHEEAISIEAGKLVAGLYDALIHSMHASKNFTESDKHTKEYQSALDDINIFCVRLVFLLYAEDSGLFPQKSQFHDYLKPRSVMAHDALEKLFAVLKTDYPQRDSYLDETLKAFSYVNGGLFDKSVKFPQLDKKSIDIIIHDMAERFNWSKISPTIFGAIFESTLNPDTRKQEGMHYTEPEIIHKVIDPLFMDGLNETFSGILSEADSFARTQKLLAFQEKLSALRFLDPACGSGNFLTESFISLRRLENRVIEAIPENLRPSAKVSITQFHGIEVHDFAVNVARTALWISDHQMWKETQEITRSEKSPLPLVDYHHIKEGSAMDSLPNLGWKLAGWKIIHDDMLYIMGNPPFLGRAKQNKGQKDDVRKIFGNGKIDYVSCWFARASEYLQEKNTKAAFIATNSITQGEQVAYVFKPLIERWHIKIDFACQSFVWKSESKDMSHVHVVIIGFSIDPPEKRKLFTAKGAESVSNINFYLHEGPDEDIAMRTDTPICDNVPAMTAGNMAADGGNLIIEADDYAEFIRREPGAQKYIKRFIMGDDFISNKPRYCLWLVGTTPDKIKRMPLVYKRVKACRELRQKSSQKRLADIPHLFREQMNPAHYVAIPKTSSEKRIYIPMAFLDDSVIPGDSLRIIPGATLYHFGVLTSRVHMAWVRRVSGRMKSDYSYSNEVVYNTFAWPSPTESQRKKIEESAQGILDARSLYPSASFAGLYDDSLMPVELRRAHERNDKAVCQAYGWDENISEGDIVRELFGLYHELVR